ncbi:MAG: nitroreductase family protein [Gammaproteobacteria bacterium]|nr:nitroreductase family protein [Gammaproteobacteria bacterium]
MKKPDLVPLENFASLPQEEMLQRSRQFYAELARRRSIREFSDRPVPRSLIENCLKAAGTAPSGANMQPWQFVAVSDKAVKRKIRMAAEDEERHFYAHRASSEWLEALAPLGTDSNKPFLDVAPWLIAVFAQKYGRLPDGRKVKHYYPVESVGLATGILITALHHAGLATLTHTPSPMKFLNKILDRPDHERPFLLLVAGYPADGCMVPNIGRKSLQEFASFLPEQNEE